MLKYSYQNKSKSQSSYSNKQTEEVKRELVEIFQMIRSAYGSVLKNTIHNSDQKNYFQVYEIFKSYSYEVLRKFISFSFENIVLKKILIYLSLS